MVMELIHILKVDNISDNEKIIIKMDKDKKLSLMEVSIKANIRWDKNMVKAYLFGRILPNILEHFRITIFMEKAFMNELMGKI